MNQNKKAGNEGCVILYHFYDNNTFLILKAELEGRLERGRKHSPALGLEINWNTEPRVKVSGMRD